MTWLQGKNLLLDVSITCSLIRPSFGVSFFSDECAFQISGITNNQNAIFWMSHKPRLVQEHERHSKKITVWRAVHSNGVLEPYYFDNETARGVDYHHLLNTYVRNSRHLFHPIHLFQQDRASARTSNLVRPLLHKVFPSSWIGKYGPYHRPARSPDLNLYDFSCGIH